MSEALAGEVGRFLDEVTPAVEALGSGVAGIRADRLGGDVALEAFDLVASFIDADGLHTDNELLALLGTFGPLLETSLGQATPADVRRNGLVAGRRQWAEQPSNLFDLLLKGDRRNGTRAARTYYERAMALGHEVAAVDVHTSHVELRQLDHFRSMLLGALEAHEVDQPRATPAAAASGPAPETTASTAGAELPPARPLDELYAELDGLVGLVEVKAEVKLVADLLRVEAMRRSRDLPVAAASRHLVFTGNPGTGKTTVARLLAQLYRTLGVVEKGHLVETDRSGLVAGFVGQTALKVREVFTSALEGVLLVDEAYALARGREGDFGSEAIDTLVKLVEDHRDDVVVILAGYPAEMATLVESNPGMRSRFPRTIAFPDYSDDELVAILISLAEESHYRVDDGAKGAAQDRFAVEPRGKGFGNGRLARNLFEAAVAHQASRVVDVPDLTDEALTTLTAADVEAAGRSI